MNHARLYLSTAVAVTLALFCAACGTQPAASEPPATAAVQDAPIPKADDKPDKKDPKTEENALEEKDLKPALLRMVDANSKPWTSLTKEVINESPLVVRKDFPGVIDIGDFSCNLKEKTFVTPNVPGPGRTVRGQFVLNERSEWVGEITDVTFAHKRP